MSELLFSQPAATKTPGIIFTKLRHHIPQKRYFTAGRSSEKEKADTMDKHRTSSSDKAKEKYRILAQLFPEAVTETIDERGRTIRAIDADILRQEISAAVVEGSQERCQLTWPDKKSSIARANRPTSKSLRPDFSGSSGYDGTPGSIDTRNIYIEGDNLYALKLLRKAYSGRIKMIFIDPPYNTGSGFIYNDDFSQSADEYMQGSGQLDENGNSLVQNPESSGRFHTDWLNMMYPRLSIARDLLTEDGVIFITLDDHENSRLRLIADEIFGEDNFITEFIWEKKKKPSFLHRNVGKLFDYILCYAKNSSCTPAFSVEKTKAGKKYPLNNAGNKKRTLIFPPHSVHFSMRDQVIQPQDMSDGNIYTRLLNELVIKNGENENEMQLEGEWRYSQSKLNEIIAKGERLTISKIPFRPNHVKTGGKVKKMKNILSPSTYKCETNEDASAQLEELFGKGNKPFDTPKPVGLLKLLIKAVTDPEEETIILDFFSGSATTAHAVMEQNCEDGGKRSFIMVQLPETISPKSEAAEAGFRTICDIGEERIRRAGNKIRNEIKKQEKENSQLRLSDSAISSLPSAPDTGFRVFRIDSSNFESPSPASSHRIVKPGRTPEDLLFHTMLELGILPSSAVEAADIGENRIFFAADRELAACFDKTVSEEAVTAAALRQPRYAVFLSSDSSEIICSVFGERSPDTVIKYFLSDL